MVMLLLRLHHQCLHCTYFYIVLIIVWYCIRSSIVLFSYSQQMNRGTLQPRSPYGVRISGTIFMGLYDFHVTQMTVPKSRLIDWVFYVPPDTKLVEVPTINITMTIIY